LARTAAGTSSAGGNPLAGAAPADPFSGNYAGDGVTVSLSGAAGAYQGGLTVQGTEYPVQARQQGSRLEGTFTAGGQVYPFSATLSGDRMTFESGGSQYTLVRQEKAQHANPLAASGAAGAGTASSLQGQWDCRTGQGTAQLAFLSDRELTFDGERTRYELAPGMIRVAGDWGPVDYRYQLSGDDLMVTAPDGGGMQCRRREGSGALGTTGGGDALLQGQICAYSSSPDGGYSTLYKLYFDGQGRFLHGTESSYSGDPGSAYGLSDNPNAGSYHVSGNAKGAPIHLTFPDGSSATAYVYFVDGDTGRILEIQLNGRLYAGGLCQ
jgi:hypothetical protein